MLILFEMCRAQPDAPYKPILLCVNKHTWPVPTSKTFAYPQPPVELVAPYRIHLYFTSTIYFQVTHVYYNKWRNTYNTLSVQFQKMLTS